IKNIIFDFAGVIVHCPYEEFIKRAFPQLAQAEDVAQLADLIFKSEVWSQYDKGLPYEELQKQLVDLLRQADHECDLENIDRLMQARKDLMLPFEDTLLLIKQLNSMNLNIFGLTNMPKEFFDHLTESIDIFKLFSGIVSSCYTGLVKPEKAIYERLLDQYQLRAEESIFIDDRAINLTPAKDLGIHTLLFVHAEQARELLNKHLDVDLGQVMSPDYSRSERRREVA
ncbi:MAG TPA: HAD family phosphatase, partial [Chlamydiales bacterium]|nr:HAD family phosphatase [Chlamydiales bacterium]